MKALAIGALFLLALAGTAYAAGFEHPTHGTKALGRGGAFTVRADDLSALVLNPAGLAKLHGTHTLISHNMTWLDIYYRRAPTPAWNPNCRDERRAECQQPWRSEAHPDGFVHFDGVRNSDPLFPLGLSMALATDFGLDDWTFAAGLYGPNAVGASSFPATGPQRFMFVSQDMLMLYPTLSVAWQYEGIVGLGASFHFVTMPTSKYSIVIDGYQDRTVFPIASEWEVLADLTFRDPLRFTMTVGAWYRPVRFLEFGLSATVIPVNISARGSISTTPLPAIVGECQTYPPEPDDPCQRSIIYGKDFELSDDRVQLDFTLPTKVSAGVRYVHWHRGAPLFDIELNINWEGWSSIDRFDVSFGQDAYLDVEINPEAGEFQRANLNDISLERRWRDTWSVRLGGDVMVLRDLLWLRAGGFFETGAVPDEYSNLDFLSFNRWGIGGGLTVMPWPGVEVSLAYLHIFQETRNLSEQETRIYQQRPAAFCDAETGYRTGPDGNVLCDRRLYYDGMPGAPAGGGLFESSFDVLSFSISVNWERAIRGRAHRAATLGRDGASAWSP